MSCESCSCKCGGCCCSSEHSGHSSSCCCSQSKRGSCGCGCKECRCQECHGHEDFAKQLIEMADSAWMEVLKEKMKAHILSTSGEHLDKLAQMVTETNNMRWKEKMSAKRGCNEFREKMNEFFNCKGQCSK